MKAGNELKQKASDGPRPTSSIKPPPKENTDLRLDYEVEYYEPEFGKEFIDPTDSIREFYQKKIGIKVQISSLDAIDIKASPPYFSCKFSIHTFFRSDLVEAPGNFPEKYTIYGVAHPSLVFGNQINIELRRDKIVKHYNGYLIHVISEYDGTFRLATSQRVSEYPFDSYDCCISVFHSSFVRLNGMKHGETKFANAASGKIIYNIDPVNDEWTVFKPRFNAWITAVGVPAYQYTFTIKRNFSDNTFTLIFIITLMNFVVFSIDQTDIAARQSFLATVALTLIAVKFSLENDLPKSSRPNYIQNYNLACVLYTVFLMFTFALEKLFGITTVDLAIAVTGFILYNSAFIYIIRDKISKINSNEVVSWKPSDDVVTSHYGSKYFNTR